MKTKKFNYFPQAWWSIANHPLLGDLVEVEMCIHIDVVKVDPNTSTIGDDDTKNTETEVWLEFGFPELNKNGTVKCYTHDVDLDCGAPTFEEAVIKLANLIKKKYNAH